MGSKDKEFNFKSPYPNLGEVLRGLAVSLDAKASERALDKFAREGEYDAGLKDRFIDNNFKNVLGAKVTPGFGIMIAEEVNCFLNEYVALVLEVGLDGISRDQALPILTKHFFAWKGACFLVKLYEQWTGPRPHFLVASGARPIEMIFEWLEQCDDEVSARIQKLDKRDKDQIRKWKSGDELPLLGSICRIGKLVTSANQKVLLESFIVWMLIARSIVWFSKALKEINLLEILREYLWAGRTNLNYVRLIKDEHCQKVLHLRPLAVAGVELAALLSLTVKRQAGDKEIALRKLEEFESILNHFDPGSITSYWFDWHYARWYLFTGDLCSAVEHYKQAFHKSIYCAGENQVAIIKEALVAAAKLGGKKALLKKLKQQAISFNLFQLLVDADSFNKVKNCVVEDWEMQQWADQYQQIFPKTAHFSEDNSEEESNVRLGPLIVGQEELELTPYLKTVDRKIKVGATWKKKMSQLNWFVEINKPEYVKELINKGASPDILSDSNDSPILSAIAEINETGDRSCYELLKDVKHDKSTINARTDKKRMTPLSCAVETSDPDIVRQVILMGAEPDMRAQTVLQTPLYQCMTYFSMLERPEYCIGLDIKRLFENHSATLESIRRHAAGASGVDHRDVADFKNSLLEADGTWERNLLNALLVSGYKKLIDRLNRAKLLQIVSILLENGANPNASQMSPVKGYTPFMLAAEIDAVDAFRMMAESNQNKGNIYQAVVIDGKSEDCWSIAYKWRSSKVLAYLQSKFGL
ncbi:hypothetical protein [Endozoicomonas sp. ALB032]|uniref:hypothetical protein n=1 Tax=Endozoicomonas sp. ALB032 TaxID=3403082 RepID=UPI003BB53A68